MECVCVCVCVCAGHEDTASGSDAGEMSAELERLRSENARLIQQQQQQQQQSESTSRHSLCGDSVQLDFIHAQQELSRCKEALIGSVFTYLLTRSLSSSRNFLAFLPVVNLCLLLAYIYNLLAHSVML